MLLDGLTYIATYSVNDFEELSNCSHVYIKKDIETNQLFFTYGTNIIIVFMIPHLSFNTLA